MKHGRNRTIRFATAAFAFAAALPMLTLAQTPVDDDGNPVGSFTSSPAHIEPVVGNEDIPLQSGTDLEELVGPIALYPDELLAIVLPASAYPLQIVEAARFLEALEDDPSLQPDSAWDDSVVALLNYPEIIEHLNEDIDWTWRLGEAVVAQQTDVVAAIERFRDRAYAAGNLKSDPYQNVTREDGVIEISPVADDVIYVPYYEPERVVVYQPRPVYYYYPRAYPVYYYPYSSAYHFDRGYFWGVTTAFTIGWLTDSLHVYHHSYHGHPYYGWTYRDRWWYRRPPISVYNTTYVRNTNVTVNRYYEGDRWSPNRERYLRDERTVRNWHHRPESTANEPRVRSVPREQIRTQRQRQQQPITFRDRPQRGEPTAYRKKERRTPVVSYDRESQRNATGVRQTQSRQNVVNRQQPQARTATRVRHQPREEVVRQQSARRESTAGPQPRRESAIRPQPRRDAVVRQQTQRSQVRKQPPQLRERASAPRPERRQDRAAPQSSESRRSQPRTQQKTSRSETRPRPERGEERRARR
ncbi:MAG: DUF3300 domain-containing protein [Gammaproteobacteria bacterium]|nr:DUF3300 domain-containing protein [Gammaproteobacteria bacterium]